MKFQKDSYSCGVFAVMNAAKCLGIDLKRRSITKYSKTTKENGTNEKGILRALSNNGMVGEEFTFKEEQVDEAFEVLDNVLVGASLNPVILSVDNDNHWCTLIGKLGYKYILFDSDRSKYNKEENGVHVLTKEELEAYWKSSTNKYYCIIVDEKIE